MSNKTVKLLAAEADREKLAPILEQLKSKGIKIESAENKLKNKELLLVGFSEKLYSDEKLMKKLFSELASETKNVMPLKIDEYDIPDELKTATRASNVISTEGRDANLIAERIIAAIPKKKLAWIFILAAVIIAAAAGYFIYQRYTEVKAAEAAAAEAARIAEEERLAAEAQAAFIESLNLPEGVTYEQLENISNVVIVGDKMILQTVEDARQDMIDLFSGNVAYRVWEDDGGHWFSTDDGSEFIMTRYDNLGFISYMTRLTRLSMAMVEADDLPDLSKADILNNVQISDCNIDNLDWLSGSGVMFLDIQNTRVIDYSPLNNCKRLAGVNVDLSRMREADFSKFSPPNLKSLNIENGEDVLNIDFSELSKCKRLDTLNLGNLQIKDLSFIAGSPYLSNLNIYECRKLTDISAVGSIQILRNLYINNCPAIKDYSPVGSCSKLQVLHIEDWDNNYSLRDASFLKDMPILTDIQLYGFPLKNLGFLEGIADNSKIISLGFGGEIQDYSGLSFVQNYSWLNINPRNNDYSLVEPYLKDATVTNLGLWNCDNLDFSSLPEIRSTLSIGNSRIKDLTGLKDYSINTLSLRSCQHLTSLNGIEVLPLLKANQPIVILEIEDCPRLTDFSALDGTNLEGLTFRGQYEIPDFSGISVNKLKLESIYGLTDLSCFETLDTDKRYSEIRLVGLDELTDITVLRNFKGNELTVPPQLAEQAQELVDSGNFGKFEVEYPDGSWNEDDSEVEILNIDELENLPKAMLKRVRNLNIIGNTIMNWDLYDTDENWENSDRNGGFPELYLENRETGERVQVDNGDIVSIDMLSNLSGLVSLQLIAQPLENLDGIQEFENLRYLRIENCFDLTDASAVFAMPQLEELCVRCSKVSSIQGVQNLSHLRQLDIFHTKVDDLSPLKESDFSEAYENGGFRLECDDLPCNDLSALSSIKVYDRLCLNNMDCQLWVDALSNCEIYTFCSCGANWDYEMLERFVSEHPEMREFELEWNSNIKDVSFLADYKNLESVRFSPDMEEAVASLNGLDCSFEIIVEG